MSTSGDGKEKLLTENFEDPSFEEKQHNRG